MGERHPAGILQLRVRDLVLLDLIHETGSLRGAASELHVTQPAITQALRALEQAVGAELVDRGTRGQRRTRLTAAGLAARDHLRVVGAELHATRRAALSTDQVFVLRIGVLTPIALDWMPLALAKLMKKLPHIAVEIVESSVIGLWRMFEEGGLHMMVAAAQGLAVLHRPEKDLTSRVVKHYQLVPAAPAGHPLFRRKSVPLSVLADQKWVLPPDGIARETFNGFFRDAGLPPPSAPVVAQHQMTRMAVAQSLNAIALVHQGALSWQNGAPKMKQLPCDLPEWSWGIVLVVRKASLYLPAVKAFYEWNF